MYIPIGSVPSSLGQLVGDLERRQAREGAASVKSASTNNSGANSVQSNNTNSTRDPGRAQPAPAPRVPIGRQPRSIDDIVSDLETRQIRGDAASVDSASTGGAGSVQSANSNSTIGQGRGPARNPPARIPVGSQPRSMDELLSDLERRRVGGGDAASVASASTNGQSVQSNDAESVESAATNNANSTSGALRPAPPARIPIGAQPRSLAELVGDLERRQVTGGDNGSVSSASTNKAKPNKAPSVKSNKESSSATPAPVTSSPAPPPPVTAPAPTTSSSALPAPAPPPSSAPTSAPAITTAPAAIDTPAPAPPIVRPPVSSANPAVPPASGAEPVQSPAPPGSSTAAPVVASPSPTTLLTRVSSSPGGGATPMPDMQLSSSTSTAGPIATVLPPAAEIPSGPSPPGNAANSEIGPPGGASMPANTMVGAVFGCIVGAGIIVAFLMVCCVRRRLAKAKRDSDLAMASQYPNEKGPRPLTEWEDRLYGSPNRSTGGGFSEKAKSIFVVPWRLLSGNRGGQEPPPPLPVLPQPPRLGGEAGPASTRYSKRSTGLTTLDEKQFKTYNNLVGRSNPKKPVAFDNPYFQRDDWK